MTSTPGLRRCLSLGGTVAVFAVVLGLLALQRRTPDAPARAADKEAARSWPMYGGTVQRNLVNLKERNIVTTWNVQKGKEKNVKWSVPLGSKAYGGPIVAGGQIYIGTNNNRPRNKAIHGDKGILMCFHESDGSFLWQAVHDKLAAGRVNDWPEEGICSSPNVQGDRLYYVSNRAEVVCASTGGLAAGNRGEKGEKYTSKHDADFIWRLDMIGQLGVFPHNLAVCSPLIVGDIIFVVTANGVDEGHINIPAPDAPSFLAISKTTGKVLWKDKSPGRKIMHGQWSNPVYAEPKGTPTISFPGGDGYIYGFKPTTGEHLWKFDCNPKKSRYELGGRGTRSDFVSTPVVWQNKLYIGVGQDPEHKKGVGHLWCIDLVKALRKGKTNKDRDVSPQKDNFDPKAAVNKDSALVWHYGGPAPEDSDSDREYLFGRTLSTCAVHEGLCYAADFDGMFYCFDANTGKKLWDHDLRADTWCSPYLVGGNVYIGNERGEINVFKHGKSKKLVSTINMGRPGAATKVRAAPVACNGVLYIITENPCRLWALAAK
jgi:outer membrane protein assembly factor BamB